MYDSFIDTIYNVKIIEINIAYVLVTILIGYITYFEFRAVFKKIFIILTFPFFRIVGYREYMSKEYRRIQCELKDRVEKNETVYLIGITLGTHNAGVSLVSVSKKKGIHLICNNEEERFSGMKHDWRFPIHSLSKLKEMKEFNIGHFCSQ